MYRTETKRLRSVVQPTFASLKAFCKDSLVSLSLSKTRFNRLLAASEASLSFFSSVSVHNKIKMTIIRTWIDDH